MSRPRARKALVATCDACPRGRGSVARASGDTALTQEPQKNHRSKSRNKIPKSIRYDLENALVGLCNVWFEDIKPHLLRNNIKVHVSCAGAEGEAGAPPSPESPPAPHSCSHLDPASTATDCKLCRLLYNASDSIERALSQAASVSLPASPPAVGESPNTPESISQL